MNTRRMITVLEVVAFTLNGAARGLRRTSPRRGRFLAGLMLGAAGVAGAWIAAERGKQSQPASVRTQPATSTAATS